MKLNHRLLAIAALSLLVVGAFAQSAKPSAEEYLTQIKAVATPAFDQTKRGDKAYIKEYIAERNKADADRNKLILDFYHAYPDNTEVPNLLDRRWATLLTSTGEAPKPADFDAAVADTAEISANAPTERIKSSAGYWKAYYQLEEFRESTPKLLAAVNEFIKSFPKDERGARLLQTAGYETEDRDALIEINKLLIKDYPNSSSAKYAAGSIRKLESVGKPFDLSFDDAVTGAKVSVAGLKGKVVLIDFWATWCGPCVAEMPHVKELYAKYHGKGLEILGVSLDQPVDKGGLDKLKAFVAQNQIPWAQYYQGNFWSSEFSTSWGINAIPALFIIDKNGNLEDVNGRQNLAQKVAKLLGD